MPTLPRAATLGNPFPLGSVSSGTLRPEDLIPAFLVALDNLKVDLSLSLPTSAGFDETEAVKREVSRIDDHLARIERHQAVPGYYDSDDAQIDLEWLTDEGLSPFAPPYVYFGAHPGDGADFGFWPDHDAIDANAVTHPGDVGETDGLLAVSDLSEVPADYSGLINHVNDHGNATLYQHDKGEFVELWSCV